MKTLAIIATTITLALTAAMVREDLAWRTEYKALQFGYELAYTIASIRR